jgi:hypothetical protein
MQVGDNGNGREPLTKGEKALKGENEKPKGKNRYTVFVFDAAPP